MVAVLTALLVMCRPAMSIKPPLKNPASPAELELPPEAPPDAEAPEPRRPPPRIRPAPPVAIVTARNVTIASASIEPPVRPTLTPRLAMKLSIFCETFKKATAQRNQIRTFPVTASLLDAATAASTSLSSRARAGTHRAESINTASNVSFIILLNLLIKPPKMTAGWQ